MAWVTPQPGTAGQVYTAAAHNVIVDDLTELAPFFGAWTSYTPTIEQGGQANIAKTVTASEYIKIGRLVIWHFVVQITAASVAGMAGFPVGVTLPVARKSGSNVSIGSGAIYDDSVSQRFVTHFQSLSTTNFRLLVDGTNGGAWGTDPSSALNTSDLIQGFAIYEAAS